MADEMITVDELRDEATDVLGQWLDTYTDPIERPGGPVQFRLRVSGACQAPGEVSVEAHLDRAAGYAVGRFRLRVVVEALDE